MQIFSQPINRLIQRLVNLIDSDYEIISVPVRIIAGATYRNCYENVEARVRNRGGRIQYGWYISENDLMCEAIHHAVWEDNKGDLIDVTPNSKKASFTLFIPDDRYIYDNKIIDSVRINKTNNPVVDDLILLAEIDSIIIAAGTRSADQQKVRFGPALADIYTKYYDLGKVVALHALEGKTLMRIASVTLERFMQIVTARI